MNNLVRVISCPSVAKVRQRHRQTAPGNHQGNQPGQSYLQLSCPAAIQCLPHKIMQLLPFRPSIITVQSPDCLLLKKETMTVSAGVICIRADALNLSPSCSS